MAIPSDRDRAVAATRFRALGDETRLRLLEILIDGDCSVGELMETTGLGQSLVSHHLGALRLAGLVTTRRAGRWIYYKTHQPSLASLKLVLQGLEPIRADRG